MVYPKDGLPSRRRRQRAWRKWSLRTVNLLGVLLSLIWLGTDHRSTQRPAATHAGAADWTRWTEWVEWIEVEHPSAAIRRALAWARMLDDEWEGIAYIPGSNQKVRRPDEWLDGEVVIVQMWPEPIEFVFRDRDDAQDEIGSKTPDRRATDHRAADPQHRRSDPRAAPESDSRQQRGKERPRRREWFTVTAYCPCKKCCGKWAEFHRTASGLPLTYNGGHLVAADTRVLPFHTRVRIPGYAGGQPVPVVDRGSAVKGKMIDVFFPTHEQAKRWGKKRLLVEILP